MSEKSTRDAATTLGGIPKVSLLPPEVLQRKRDKATRRTAVAVVLLALVIAGLATGGAVLYSISQQVILAGAQSRTVVLLEQQKEFADVRAVTAALAAAKQARITGGSTEVDWKAWNAAAVSQLPAGARVVSMTVDSGTPTEIFPAATVPLEDTRIGAITYELGTASLVDLQAWIDSLTTTPGFVDATPKTVTRDPVTSEYISTTVIHINALAYSLRFEPKK